MKWFKHITTSLDDPFIFDLIDQFSSDGYLVYFGTVEIMAREFDVKNPGKCELSVKFLRKKLQLSARKVTKILNFCDEKQKIFVKFDGNKTDRIELNCPKLKEMADEWTKRKLSSGSVVTPKKLSIDIDKEEDKDIKIPPKPKKQPKEYSREFLEFYRPYPKHEAKAEAYKSWNRLKKSQELPDIKILLSAIEQQKKKEGWKNGQYIPQPSTWLNQKRWEDEVGITKPIEIEEPNDPIYKFAK